MAKVSCTMLASATGTGEDEFSLRSSSSDTGLATARKGSKPLSAFPKGSIASMGTSGIALSEKFDSILSAARGEKSSTTISKSAGGADAMCTSSDTSLEKLASPKGELVLFLLSSSVKLLSAATGRSLKLSPKASSKGDTALSGAPVWCCCETLCIENGSELT